MPPPHERKSELFRQGKPTGVRQLFTEAEAKMKPLPAAAQWPLTGGAGHDDLILWLDCKEARALLTPPETSSP